MPLEDIDPNNGTLGAALSVHALHNVVIQMLLVPQYVHSFEYKLEQRFQVFGAWTGHEDVRITVGQGSRNCQSKCSGLSTATGSGKGDGRGQSFLGYGLNKR
jgi:hypothetical protein